MSSNCQLEASKSISDSIVDTYSSFYTKSMTYLRVILVIEVGENDNMNTSIRRSYRCKETRFFIVMKLFFD